MIRRANLETDYDVVWEIFYEVIQSGDTYVFRPGTPKEDLKMHWFASYMETYVYEEDGKIFGTYILKRNQIDLGSHIANASYMVHPEHQGKKIGRKMCEHSIAEAKSLGFQAIQFNLVVATNVGAVALWKKMGFRIIGEIPKAFQHAQRGYVNAYIMYQSLS